MSDALITITVVAFADLQRADVNFGRHYLFGHISPKRFRAGFYNQANFERPVGLTKVVDYRQR